MGHVFISYSKEDVEYVRELVKTLLAQGFNVWIDDRSLRSSEDWWQSIVLSIRQSSAMIIVLTPSSDSSSWVQREITLALKYEKPIYPLWLFGSIDTPNWELFVRTQYHDVRGGKMPEEKFFGALALNVGASEGIGKDITTTINIPPVDVHNDEIFRNAIQNPPNGTPGIDKSQKQSPIIIAIATIIVLAIVFLIVQYVLSEGSTPLAPTPVSATIMTSEVITTEPLPDPAIEITGENFLDLLNTWRNSQNPAFLSLLENDTLSNLADEQGSYLYNIAPNDLPGIRDTQFQGDTDIVDTASERGYSGEVEIFVEIRPDEEALSLDDVIFILERRGSEDLHSRYSEIGYSLSLNPITGLKYFVILLGNPGEE